MWHWFWQLTPSHLSCAQSYTNILNFLYWHSFFHALSVLAFAFTFAYHITILKYILGIILRYFMTLNMFRLFFFCSAFFPEDNFVQSQTYEWMNAMTKSSYSRISIEAFLFSFFALLVFGSIFTIKSCHIFELSVTWLCVVLHTKSYYVQKWFAFLAVCYSLVCVAVCSHQKKREKSRCALRNAYIVYILCTFKRDFLFILFHGKTNKQAKMFQIFKFFRWNIISFRIRFYYIASWCEC